MTVTVLTDQNYEEQFSATKTTKYVIDFHAKWCAPCKTFAPVYEAASNEVEDVSFFSVDVDENPKLVTDFEIRSMPTLVVVTPDDIRKKSGAMSRAAFDEFLAG